MEIKESDIKLSVQINIVAATAFAQQAVGAFMSPMYVYFTSCVIANESWTNLLCFLDPVTSNQVELSFSPGLLQLGGGQTLSALSQLGNMVFELWVRCANHFPCAHISETNAPRSQKSIAREYGPQGVHVAFVVSEFLSIWSFGPRLTILGFLIQVIDGIIITKRTLALFGDKKETGWLHDEKQRLSPESIAKCYMYLHLQTPDCWTLEMDLR